MPELRSPGAAKPALKALVFSPRSEVGNPLSLCRLPIMFTVPVRALSDASGLAPGSTACECAKLRRFSLLPGDLSSSSLCSSLEVSLFIPFVLEVLRSTLMGDGCSFFIKCWLRPTLFKPEA